MTPPITPNRPIHVRAHLRHAFIFGAIILAALIPSASSAETSRWQLGNPSLIIDLPGDPSSATPTWKERDTYAFLVSAWRAETDDARVEASVDYSSASLDDFTNALATRLGGKAENKSSTSLSGYKGYQFTVGQNQCLVAGGFGRYWSIVAVAKTQTGTAIVQQSLGNARAEKWETPRWVPRSFGQTFLLAQLPYDLDLIRSGEGNAPTVYALNYNDMEVEALVNKGAANSIDIKGTFDNLEKEIKSRENVKDFKASRRRVKAQNLEGDEMVMEFQEGTKKYKVRYYAFKHNGDALRLKFTTNQDNAAQAEDVDRMLASLKSSNVVLNGFESREIGTDGLWLDLPGTLEKSNPQEHQRFYEKLFGGYLVDVRITDTDRVGNTAQLADFVEAGAKSSFKATDTKFERTEINIDGVAGYRMEGTYKNGSITNTLRLYILEAPGRVYVIRSAVMSSQVDVLDRIFGSMRIEPPAAPGYSRRIISKSGLAASLSQNLDYQDLGADEIFSEARMAEFTDNGLNGFFLDFKIADPDNFQVAQNFKLSLEEFTEGLGIKARIKSQKQVTGGIHAEVELTLDGTTLPGDWIMVKRNGYLTCVLVVYQPDTDQAAQKRFTLVNSIR